MDKYGKESSISSPVGVLAVQQYVIVARNYSSFPRYWRYEQMTNTLEALYKMVHYKMGFRYKMVLKWIPSVVSTEKCIDYIEK